MVDCTVHLHILLCGKLFFDLICMALPTHLQCFKGSNSMSAVRYAKYVQHLGCCWSPSPVLQLLQKSCVCFRDVVNAFACRVTNLSMLVFLQYVTWAELIYIQLLTPNASFLGHLAGILAGMLHVTVLQHLPMLHSRPTPFSGTSHTAQDADPAAVSTLAFCSDQL